MNYENDGAEVKGYAASLYKSASRTIKSMSEYFKPCISWSKVTTIDIAFRYYPNGYVFDVAGCCIFYTNENKMLYHFGFLNSKICTEILKIISSTMNYEAGHIASMPILLDSTIEHRVIELVKHNIEISMADWDSFEKEAFFENYSFTQEVLLVVIGAVFGGICTVIINKGAIRKQCKFDMQYKILSEEIDNIADICKKNEAIEIGLSFGTGETAPFKDEINEIQYSLLSLNERLRSKRKFVRKYLSAVIVEKSAQFVTDYTKVLYIPGNEGFWDWRMVAKVDTDGINSLRKFSQLFKNLNNDMTEAMETIIEPGVIAKLKRKLRKPGMFLEECYAISKVHKREKKEDYNGGT